MTAHQVSLVMEKINGLCSPPPNPQQHEILCRLFAQEHLRVDVVLKAIDREFFRSGALTLVRINALFQNELRAPAHDYLSESRQWASQQKREFARQDEDFSSVPPEELKRREAEVRRQYPQYGPHARRALLWKRLFRPAEVS